MENPESHYYKLACLSVIMVQLYMGDTHFEEKEVALVTHCHMLFMGIVMPPSC